MSLSVIDLQRPGHIRRLQKTQSQQNPTMKNLKKSNTQV
jgi:hypothetical protein